MAELTLGKKIVSDTDTASLLVVGAIRAEASCLRCHGGYGVGDLLGAFRYVLQHP